MKKDPNSLFERRSPGTGIRSTPDRFFSSPSPHYSEASTVSSKTSKNNNPLAISAKAVAGLFVTCFTPPVTHSSKNFINSNGFKAPPVSLSDASRGGSEGRRGTNRGVYASSNNTTRAVGNLQITMEEIYKATRKFSPSSKIGQGGFATVYKGTLEDGTVVAIKRAKKNLYDKHLGVEFESEIRTLAQVEHLKLVKFYGYLEFEDERIVIVEYVPNGTLREHLDCLRGSILDFAARLDISIDVAHAITYLHMYIDRPIIHRDIKSSNILLTENFGAKVADFGFSRLAANADSGYSHVSTQVKGTAGYLDPEYLKTHQLTEKSDVYSFGVLLVELVTGRRPIEPKRGRNERLTVIWAMNKLSDGDAISILDPRLEHTTAVNLAIEKILQLAFQCLAPRRQNRPTMRRCAEILWSIRKDYKERAASDIRLQASYSQSSSSTS